MNTIIFFIGLILIIVAIIIILYSRKTHVDEDYMTNDTNPVFRENEKGLKKILNDFNIHDNNNEFVFDDEENLPYLSNMTFENMNIETKDDNIINHKEEIEDDPKDNNFDRIIELSKSGLRAEEIAKILGRGIREVEITLKFYNRKSN